VGTQLESAKRLRSEEEQKQNTSQQKNCNLQPGITWVPVQAEDHRQNTLHETNLAESRAVFCMDWRRYMVRDCLRESTCCSNP